MNTTQTKNLILVALMLLGVQAHAVELKDLHVSRSTVTGGEPIDVTVSLDTTGTAHPQIRSAKPEVIDIPAQTMAIVNRSWAEQRFHSNPVSSPEDVLIIATLNGVSKSKLVRVNPGPSPRKVHDLSGGQIQELIQLAMDNGYGFTHQVTQGAGDCEQEPVNLRSGSGWWMATKGEVIKIGKNTNVKPITCLFYLFETKSLRNGWKIVGTNIEYCKKRSVSPYSCRILRHPNGRSADPRIRVELSVHQDVVAGAYAQSVALLNKLTLEGPSGEDWRMAVQP